MDKNFFFAFGLSLLAGLSTSIGALMAFRSKGFKPKFLAAALGFLAGVMIYICLDELLPTTEEYGEHHVAIDGLVLGMAVMAVSLLLLA